MKNQSTQSYYAGAAGTDTTNRINYSAHGAVSAIRLGNQKWEHTTFNARLQPTRIALGAYAADSSLLRLDYSYGSTANNGNIVSQTLTVPGAALTQNYTYDELNRLKTATEAGVWDQTFDYDRWGNRALRVGSYMINGSQTPQSASATDFSAFNQANNRLSQAVYPSVQYDDAGNLKRDAVGNQMGYDGENRLVSYNGTAGKYYYDGDGRRVKKEDSTGTTVYVYNAAGQLIAEYATAAAQGGGTSYLTADHLGSTRVVTDSAGNVKARYDYLPFGEEMPASVGSRSAVAGYQTSNTLRQKFAGYEREAE